MNSIGDFIYDNLGVILVFAFIFLLGLLFYAVSTEEKQRVAFMEQCLEDRKQYECEALWGQAKGSDTSTAIATGLAIGIASGAAGRR